MDPSLAEARRKKRLQNQQKREKQILDLAGLKEPPKTDFPSSLSHISPNVNKTGNNNNNNINNNNDNDKNNNNNVNLQEKIIENTNNNSKNDESTDINLQSDHKKTESISESNSTPAKGITTSKNQRKETSIIDLKPKIISTAQYLLYFISFILGLSSVKYGLLIFYISCFVLGLFIPIFTSFWGVKFTFSSRLIPLLIADIISFSKCFGFAYFSLIVSRTISLYVSSKFIK